jgi:hypothetical protein
MGLGVYLFKFETSVSLMDVCMHVDRQRTLEIQQYNVRC